MRHFKKTTTLLLTTAVLFTGKTMLDLNTTRGETEAFSVHAEEAQEKETEPAIATATIITTTPWPTKAPTPKPEPSPEPGQAVRIYDIPLAEELQEYTYNLCQKNDLDYEFTLAVMEQESDYREKVISRTNDYGIMQINQVNHEWLKEKLGIEDFLDAKQNIQAGIYMLTDLTTRYEDPHKALMAYNAGEAGAKRHWDKGTTTSGYSREVMARAEELREEGRHD